MSNSIQFKAKKTKGADGAATRKTPMSRTEAVHEALRLAIIDQSLKPGVRLPEDAIGDSFGTSRTIAREALGRLAVEGLVDLIPNRGAFVANPSLEDGHQIFAVRRGLERTVVTSLAGMLKPDDIALLRRFIDQERSIEQYDTVQAMRLAGEFHLTLARLTGNQLLVRYVTEVVSRCSLIMSMYGRPHSSECAVNEHMDIVEALVAGDADMAGNIMERHVGAVASRAMLTGGLEKDIRETLAPYALKML